MTDNSLITLDNNGGRDSTSGRFSIGNQYGGKGGRPIGPKPRLGESVIKAFAKHWDKNGAKAIARLYKEDLPTYCKLAVHLTPKEVILQAQVSHSVDLKAEINVFSTTFDEMKEIVGIVAET
jgi:hypothetical protein